MIRRHGWRWSLNFVEIDVLFSFDGVLICRWLLVLSSGVSAEETLTGSQTLHEDQTHFSKIEDLADVYTYGSSTFPVREAIEIVK
jgi:hypothetical protein